VVNYYGGTRRARRRDAWIAGGLLLIALILLFLPAQYQRPIRQTVRGTVLRPFVGMQGALAARRSRSVDVAALQAQRDSLVALVAAQGTLAEENRRLRGLLGLRARAERAFRPAELLRPGVIGSESTFLVDVGDEDGVVVGSPVLAPAGLVGVVWEVGPGLSQGIDWTHPEFRASAMTADGVAYGIVEPRRGRFREEDMLVLTGAPFHTDIPAGTRIVTSGFGGIFPRGIPIGVVVGIEDADTGWRKSYLIRPAVRPEGVSHVLVAVRGEGVDLAGVWNVPAPAGATQPGDSVAPAPVASRPRAPASAPATRPAEATGGQPAQETAEPPQERPQRRLLGTPVDSVGRDMPR